MTALLHSLAGRVVIVTGAGSGMGRATALATAASGAHVVLAARRANLLEATAAEITDVGGQALVVPSDLTVQADVRRLVDTALGISGRIDVLVHAAGTNIKERAVTDTTLENGWLRGTTRSHRGDVVTLCPGNNGLSIPEQLFASGQAVPLPMRAGSILLLHKRIIHASLPNVTEDQVRLSFDL